MVLSTERAFPILFVNYFPRPFNSILNFTVLFFIIQFFPNLCWFLVLLELFFNAFIHRRVQDRQLFQRSREQVLFPNSTLSTHRKLSKPFNLSGYLLKMAVAPRDYNTFPAKLLWWDLNKIMVENFMFSSHWQISITLLLQLNLNFQCPHLHQKCFSISIGNQVATWGFQFDLMYV